MGKETSAPKERRKGILDEMEDLEARREKRRPAKGSAEEKASSDLDLGRIG